jgi:hypothetical protein
MSAPDVELLIERLVLPEMRPWEQREVAEALERELRRLLAERGVPPGLADADGAIRVSLPAVRVAAGLRPAAIGARVAEAIYANVAGGAPARQTNGGPT